MFELEIDDGWPPVGVEALWCEEDNGLYTLKNAPFFVKGLSVGDVFLPRFSNERKVLSWEIVTESKNSIMWVMINNGFDINSELTLLKSIGCNIAELKQLSYVSIEIPESVNFEKIKEIFSRLNEDVLSYAFPVFRHG